MLIYILQVPLLSLLLSCSYLPHGSSESVDDSVEVERARYAGLVDDPLEVVCREWSLNPAQVRQFFALSSQYTDVPYGEFYQIPCAIEGNISAEGRVWHFAINGGGTATWRSGSEVRYWGCRSKECDPLVLLPSDGMDSD